MSKIRVMSDALSNLIAAGEVIERPASVVKELVENSIDAGAKMITIQIERAGSRLISVKDDGCGMDADDALMALEPHGTSKLMQAEDMNHINTLGFRGEAIPSIASVSKFTLQTRQNGSLEATAVEVSGGKLISVEPAGGKCGTEIRVRDLFFNVPARKKFLKSPATEEHHIEEAVIAIALGHCEVGFQLILDGRTAFLTPPASPENRLRELFGRNYVEHLVSFEHHEGNYDISGFIAAPGFTRPSRREQRLFINTRPIEAQALYRGIRDGYGAWADSSGRYPPCLLFLTMPPEELDINVHPAKREVRFKSEYLVSRAVSCAIGNALRRRGVVPMLPKQYVDSNDLAPEASGANAVAVSNPTVVNEAEVNPVADLSLEDVAKQKLEPLSGQVPLAMILDSARVDYNPRQSDQPELPESITPVAPAPENVAADELGTPLTLTDHSEPENALPEVPTEKLEREPVAESDPLHCHDGWPTEILGIYDDTYILCAGPEGLVMIDQHAAHERVLFEEVLADWQSGTGASQRQLFAGTLELSRSQLSLFLRHRKIFEDLGFDLEPAGGTTVLINAIPARIPDKRNPAEIINDMLNELVDNRARNLPVEMNFAARAACRAAVKAHDVLDLSEARELLAKLRRCRQGTLCPHGRPTMVTLSLHEIEKRFGRR